MLISVQCCETGQARNGYPPSITEEKTEALRGSLGIRRRPEASSPILSVSEGLAPGSVCSHGPESCCWFKFCPHLVEEHQIPGRELSVHMHACTRSHRSRSRKRGNKQELNQGLGNCQAQVPSAVICCRTKTVCWRINLCTGSK